jgi:hypothetical protein
MLLNIGSLLNQAIRSQLVCYLHSNKTFIDNNNTMAYLTKARTVKPAEPAVSRGHARCLAKY